MLRLLLLLSLAIVMLSPAVHGGDIPAGLADQQISAVDAVSGLLAVGADPANRRNYRCTPETEILLNDQPAKLADLAPGMLVVVTAAKPGVATRVAAVMPRTTEKKLQKIVMQQTVLVDATNTGRRALGLCNVHAGQLVKIVAKAVRWTSGGRKKGVFCDWNGYADERLAGMPRMALVAFVGKAPFLPSGDQFTFTVPADGVLGVFANDDDPAGNEGRAEVVVTVAWY